jgi:DENN (AEX-3) domain
MISYPFLVGSDVCLVSAAVMGLQSLLRPLEWVAPAISILPHKLVEFLECPVPLMAGLVVESIEPQTESLPNMSSSTTFYFSPTELKSVSGLRNLSGKGVRCCPGTLQAASLRAARLLLRCGYCRTALHL